MRRILRKRPALGVALWSTIAILIGTAVALAIDWFPESGSTAAEDIDNLWDVLLIFSVPIFVLVMAVALYAVFAFRVKPGETHDGAPIHGNTLLEVVWVTIPFLIVTGLAIYAWVVLDDIEAKERNPLIVNVTAQQFAWSFDYPSLNKLKSNQLVLPKGRRVEFRVKTKDVIHSFWVPEFRLKTDTVPGITTKVRLTPDRLGRYEVVCTELCGLGHATMRQAVRVLSPTAFEAWVESETKGEADGGVSAAAGDTAEAGKTLFTDSGCNACHKLSDAGSDASVGPALDDLKERATKLGKQERQTAEEYVRTAIEDPDAYVAKGFPKGTMPSTYKDDLSSAEIDTLVKYLLGMKDGATK